MSEIFRWLSGAEEAPYKTILINWAKTTGKAPGYPSSSADHNPSYWGCRDKAALAQFALLWPGLGKSALTTDGTCITSVPVAELTDAIKTALQQWQTGGTPVNPCPPGSQLDPTGKLCVPKLDTSVVMDFFKMPSPAAAPPTLDLSKSVNFMSPPPPGDTSPPKGEAKADAPSKAEIEAGAAPKSEVPADDIIATCPPGYVLVNTKCMPLPQMQPEEKPAAEKKKTPWGWIALGVAGAAGLAWALTRSSREISGTLRANPRFKKGDRVRVSPRTLADVKAANKAAGSHWFDRDSMTFFNTRIESKLLAGNYFITSELLHGFPRRYSIRQAQPDGNIATIGEFQGFTTRAAAMAAIKELQSRG